MKRNRLRIGDNVGYIELEVQGGGCISIEVEDEDGDNAIASITPLEARQVVAWMRRMLKEWEKEWK
jgi:hypothetical protein